MSFLNFNVGSLKSLKNLVFIPFFSFCFVFKLLSNEDCSTNSLVIVFLICY